MALTVASTPRWLLGGSLYSNLLASHAPHVFRLTRRDYAINSVSEIGGSGGALRINVTYTGAPFQLGDVVYVCYLSYFDGPATITAISGANIDLDATRDLTAARVLYYVNAFRPDYRIECRLTDKGPDGAGTLVRETVTITTAPDGAAYFDPTAYVRRVVDALPTNPGAGWEQWADDYRYQLSFRELYEVTSGAWIDAGTFSSHYAGIGTADEGAENIRSGWVVQNALPEASKPKLGNALTAPRAFSAEVNIIWPLPFRVILDGNQAAVADANTFTFYHRERTTSGNVDRTRVASQFYPGNYWFWALNPLQTLNVNSLQFWAEMGTTGGGGGETNSGGGGPAFAATITPASGTTVWRWPDGTTTTANTVSEAAAGLPGVFGFQVADPVNLNAMTFNTSGLSGPLSLAWPGARIAALTVNDNAGLTEITLPSDMSAVMDTVAVFNNAALVRFDASNAWLGTSFKVYDNAALEVIQLNEASPFEDPFTFFDLSNNNLTRGPVPAVDVAHPRLGAVNSCAVDLSDNDLQGWQVDEWLNKLANVFPSGYTGRTINIAGSNAAPTSASAGARAILAARGVTVTTT